MSPWRPQTRIQTTPRATIEPIINITAPLFMSFSSDPAAVDSCSFGNKLDLRVGYLAKPDFHQYGSRWSLEVVDSLVFPAEDDKLPLETLLLSFEMAVLLTESGFKKLSFRS